MPQVVREHPLRIWVELGRAIERLLVTVSLEAHRTLPRQIILDLDAADDPLHRHQEGRFFHCPPSFRTSQSAGRLRHFGRTNPTPAADDAREGTRAARWMWPWRAG